MPFDKFKIDVIVADDEVANRMVAAMNLGMSGFDEERIHECDDGEEAIIILKNLRNSEESLPVIVLLDLHMPGGLDGNIAAVRIRKDMDKFCNRRPFLVCCSAEVVEHLRERPWATSVHAFSAKPLLESVIQEMMEECERTYGS